MSDAADFARIALSLAGTAEAAHFDRRAFRVARIYATLAADGRTANVKLSPDEQGFKTMLHPEGFSTIPNGFGRMGWTTIELQELNVEELRSALEMAWAHALPRPKARR